MQPTATDGKAFDMVGISDCTSLQASADLGELRAVADVLGHSPEMLLRVYAHALPDSVRAVAERIGHRARQGSER